MYKLAWKIFREGSRHETKQRSKENRPLMTKKASRLKNHGACCNEKDNIGECAYTSEY